MLYYLIRSVLFGLEPEFSHDLTFKALKWIQKTGIFSEPRYASNPVECFGVHFPNRVGLAAGLDKNAECIPAWQALGFGFIEVGTVTPRAQAGNPKPRLFRLTEDNAIINRLGFNNLGIDYLIEQVKAIKRACPIGINIGKNRDTALENAADDYLYCFEKAYDLADYVTVNISSPNTPGLRSLQQSEQLQAILTPLIEARKRLSDKYSKHVPLLVKISPDLAQSEIVALVDDLITLQIDGVIATNTTISRSALLSEKAKEEGGLSGAPLMSLSTEVVRSVHQLAGDKLPIIAVGGILSASDAKAKLDAGAKLVQIYTGFIYQGPKLIKQIASMV